MHETCSLHKDGGSAIELWRFHKNWRSSTMSVKDDRTKLLLKILIPWSSSVKAVSVYLKQKLKEQFVMLLRKSCHVLAVGVLEITTIFKRDGDNQIFLNGDVLLNGSRVDWLGWDFEMEPWKDSCCSKREASAEVGDQGKRHSTCEQIVC